MLCVPVAATTQFSKEYSSRCFEDLDDLQRQIQAVGRKVVHLISVNRWDGSWEYDFEAVRLAEFSERHLDWLGDQGAADRRYLVCGL